jgi:hypothetical protein
VSLYNNAAQFSQFVRRSAHPVTPRGAAPLPTQLLLVYKSKNGKSVLTPENLENARRLEAWIAAHPTYQKLCTRVGYQCQPPTSAVPYYFPSAGYEAHAHPWPWPWPWPAFRSPHPLCDCVCAGRTGGLCTTGGAC